MNHPEFLTSLRSGSQAGIISVGAIIHSAQIYPIHPYWKNTSVF